MADLLGGRFGVAIIALAVSFIAMPAAAALAGAEAAPDVAVKAAFLYNFAKFAAWPALPAGGPIIACIAGDDGIGAALSETIRGQNIGGHTFEVRRSPSSATWPVCHLLFIAGAEVGQSEAALTAIRLLPVLTVSDGESFSDEVGMIEFYVEGGRMRFAINVDVVERSGLRLSSRLLGLAKIVRSSHGP